MGIGNITHGVPLGEIDHAVLEFEHVVSEEPTKESRNQYQEEIHRRNFTEPNKIFRNINWEVEFHSQSVEQCYKRWCGCDNVNMEQRRNKSIKGRKWKLRRRRAKKEVSRYLFSNRIVSEWNKVSEDIVSTENIMKLKGLYS